MHESGPVSRVSSISQIEVTVHANANTEEALVSISCVPKFSWQWWPSLRQIHRVLHLPPSLETRDRLRAMAHRRCYDNRALHSHSTAALKRLVARRIATDNANLWKRRFDSFERHTASVSFDNTVMQVDIPIIAPSGTTGLTGTFTPDVTELDGTEGWGTLAVDSGGVQRVLSTQLNQMQTAVVSSAHSSWEEHIWKTVKNRASGHAAPRAPPARRARHVSIRTPARSRRRATRNHAHAASARRPAA